jgi:hypothetical protein
MIFEFIFGVLALAIPGVVFGLLTFGAWTIGSRRCRDCVWMAVIACLAITGYLFVASLLWVDWAAFLGNTDLGLAQRFWMAGILIGAAVVTAARRAASGRQVAKRYAPPAAIEYLLWVLFSLMAGVLTADFLGRYTPEFAGAWKQAYETHGAFGRLLSSLESLVFVSAVCVTTLIASTVYRRRTHAHPESASATEQPTADSAPPAK